MHIGAALLPVRQAGRSAAVRAARPWAWRLGPAADDAARAAAGPAPLVINL